MRIWNAAKWGDGGGMARDLARRTDVGMYRVLRSGDVCGKIAGVVSRLL